MMKVGLPEVVTVAIASPKVVTVSAYAEVDGRPFEGTGSAKCDPHDQFDITTGLELASGRAIRQLGREILKAGHARVSANDKIRQAQEEARAALERKKAQDRKKAQAAARKRNKENA